MTRILAIVFIACLAASAGATDKLPEYKVTREDIAPMSANMQQTFAGLQYLLNGYQIRHFLNLPSDAERETWLELFWKLRDPTPTTETNEMAIEHTIRVKLASEYFGSQKWPGWDKRGEVFIRYGPPNYRGKVWGSISVNRGLEPPRELWYYVGHDMLVAFQNFGLKGEYIYAIDALGASADVSPELAEFLMYETHMSLANRIPQNLLEAWIPQENISLIDPRQTFEIDREQNYLESRERQLPDEIDQIINPELNLAAPKDVSAIFHKEKIREVANNFEITLEDTPASYPFNFNRRELPFIFGVDQFKAGETTSRVDVAIEVPLEVKNKQKGRFEELFTAEVVVWDSDFTEVARERREVRLQMGGVAEWRDLLPTQLTLSLEPGYYRMAIQMDGAASGASSSYRTSFSCEPFAPDLAISDILFARRIQEATTPSIFTRGTIDVVPHPARTYSRSVSVPIYFEVYNLAADTRGVASYTIEYKIAPHSNQKKQFWDRFGSADPVAASRFQTSVFGKRDARFISIDVSSLDNGPYDLLITVTDDANQQVTFARGTFNLID